LNNDVTIGNWRAGLNKTLAADLKFIEDRYRQGFRQLPYESTVMALALILDAYDKHLDQLPKESDGCDCMQCQDGGQSRTHIELVEVVESVKKPSKKLKLA
jgi:hypothetical protein